MDELKKEPSSPDSQSAIFDDEKKQIPSKTRDVENTAGVVHGGSTAGSSLRRSSLIGNLSDRIEDAKHLDPFIGDEEGEVHYRSLHWSQVALIMSAETLSTGILTLPLAFKTLGMGVAIPLTIFIGYLNWYSGLVIYQMWRRFPFIHTFADAGEVLFAAIGFPNFGRELFGVMQILVFTLQASAHVNLWTNCLRVLSDHSVCNIVWSVVGLFVFLICGLPRTLKGVSYLSAASMVSIISALVVVMAAVGADPPAGHGPVHASSMAGTPFYRAFLATSNIQFAYSGHCAIFTFICELRKPDTFPKANIAFTAVAMACCLTFGIVTYNYAGAESVSPALNIPSATLSKVAWGVAIPTIVVAGVIYGHCAVKYVYVRIFRGTKHLHSRSFYSLGVWFGLSLCAWLFSWIISESIPVFSDLLAFVSSLVATWFTFGFPGIFWFFINHGQYFTSPRKCALFGLNVVVMIVALTYCIAGFYSSGTAIHVDTRNGASVWAC